MSKKCFGVSVMAALLALPLAAAAGAVSYVGALDPYDANDVALFNFTLTTAGSVDIQSWGYGGTGNAAGGTNAAGAAISSGGFDTYLSLFSGFGNTATFLASNDDGTCPVGAFAPACRDSALHFAALAAGDYTLALSVFGNMSFAENYGGGTLGDGFTGLADYYNADSGTVRSSNYALDITTADAGAIPEPGALALVLIGLLASATASSAAVRPRPPTV